MFFRVIIFIQLITYLLFDNMIGLLVVGNYICNSEMDQGHIIAFPNYQSINRYR